MSSHIPDKFVFNSRDEVIAFDNMLRDYAKERSLMPSLHVSLIQVYDKSQTMDNGMKIFYCYFDILIDVVHLFCDMFNSASTWNIKFAKDKVPSGTVIDSREIFFGKMDIHRYRVSFILRYRAIWDKLMGFLILVYSPNEYNNFYSSKMKKKSFTKIAKKFLPSNPYFLELIIICNGPLTQFDDMFRTPEAHGTGKLRKWSFLMIPANEDPAWELLGYWNMLNHFLHKTRKIFD